MNANGNGPRQMQLMSEVSDECGGPESHKVRKKYEKAPIRGTRYLGGIVAQASEIVEAIDVL